MMDGNKAMGFEIVRGKMKWSLVADSNETHRSWPISRWLCLSVTSIVAVTIFHFLPHPRAVFLHHLPPAWVVAEAIWVQNHLISWKFQNYGRNAARILGCCIGVSSSVGADWRLKKQKDCPAVHFENPLIVERLSHGLKPQSWLGILSDIFSHKSWD